MYFKKRKTSSTSCLLRKEVLLVKTTIRSLQSFQNDSVFISFCFFSLCIIFLFTTQISSVMEYGKLRPPMPTLLKQLPLLSLWSKNTVRPTFHVLCRHLEFMKSEIKVCFSVLPSISINIEPESNYISEEYFESFQLKISAKYVFPFLFHIYALPFKSLGVSIVFILLVFIFIYLVF